MKEDSEFLGSANDRTESHQRNEDLDNLIDQLSSLLTPVQSEINQKERIPSFPIALVIGSPRSGTTLLTQWLSSLGCFSYPTNLLARFSYASSLGVMIEKMIYDPKYSYHNDLGQIQRLEEFRSSLGKSSGALEPNEFFHFWRKFIPNKDLAFIEKSDWNNFDLTSLKTELSNIEYWHGKPFICKGMFIQYNLNDFLMEFPKSIFLHIKRDPVSVMESIYRSRIEMYGSIDTWWSVKPKEYDTLKAMDAYHQIAGQVYYTIESIDTAFDSIPQKNKLTIDYSDFCNDPKAVFDQLKSKYAANGFDLELDYTGPESFTVSQKAGLDPKEKTKLIAAYQHFSDLT